MQELGNLLNNKTDDVQSGDALYFEASLPHLSIAGLDLVHNPFESVWRVVRRCD